jgi:hypothetical protein
MKLLKLITAYCMFSHASLITDDKAITPQDTSTDTAVLPEVSEKTQPKVAKSTATETKPEDSATKKDTADVQTTEKKEAVLEKNDTTKWQDHLKTFLVKGAFWDSSSNSPTPDWINSTETIAEEVLTKDISQADELKTSFAATINEKFLTIEKGTNIVPIASLINTFNEKIDDVVKKLSGAKTTEEKQPEKPQESTEEVPTPIETVIPDAPSEQSASTEKIELTDEQKAANEQEKRNKKLKQQWIDCLESIKSEGTSSDEVSGMIDEISIVVTQLIEQFPLELNSLKGEFLDAIKERHGKALIQFSEQSVQDITNLFDRIQEQQQIPVNMPMPAAPLEKTPQKPAEQKISSNKQKQQLSNTATSQAFIIQEQVQDNSSVIAAQKFAADQRSQAQKSLAAKMQQAAQQKAELIKADAQRGILSSIAKAILPESWTGGNEAEKIITTLLHEQMAEIDAILATEKHKNLSDDSKNQIKLAYELFQKTLLSINSQISESAKNKTLDRNKASDEELQKWLKTMAKTSFILIKNDIMPFKEITQALKQTCKTYGMSDARDDIKTALINAIKIETEKQQKIDLAEAKKQQKIEDEKRKEIENKRLEEKRKQQELLDLERTKIEEEQRKEFNKKVAFDTFEHLKSAWVELLKEIAYNTAASAEQNKVWTTDALKITQDMIKLIPVMGMNNQPELITKHKIDFSRALLAQQENNTEKINIHANMDIFNKSVHEL